MLQKCCSFELSIHQRILEKRLHGLYTRLNNAGLFEPKFGWNMDKPKCWVKNV